MTRIWNSGRGVKRIWTAWVILAPCLSGPVLPSLPDFPDWFSGLPGLVLWPGYTTFNLHFILEGRHPQ